MKTRQEREIAQILRQLDQAPLPDKQGLLAACPEPTRTQRPPDAPAVKPRGVRWRPRTVCAAVCAAAILLLAGGQGLRGLYRLGLSAGIGVEPTALDLRVRQYSAAEVQQGGEGGVLEKTVEGYALPSGETHPEDYAAYFETETEAALPNGAVYRFYEEYWGRDFEKGVFEKYVDGQLAWTAEFPDFYVSGYTVAGGAVAVYGRAPVAAGGEAWVALLDADDGRIRWQTALEGDTDVGAVLLDTFLGGVSSVDVFSAGEGFLRLDRFDGDGNRRLSQKTEVASGRRVGVENAVRAGGGYVVQITDWNVGWEIEKYAQLLRLDGAGRVTGAVQCEADDVYYHIVDMAEFEGKLYLSAYAFPIEGNTNNREINAVLNTFGQEYAENKELFQNAESVDKVLTPLTRENYTAVLLVCTPETGTPQAAYIVDGGIGGGLDLSDAGQLIWNVESLSATSYSPFTSAYTIRGVCRVYQAVIGGNGSLQSWKDSGELTAFYR